jgi:hypothetical protein
VDEWFKKEVADRGASLTSPKWRRYEFARTCNVLIWIICRSYVDQLLLDDQSKFKGLTPGAAIPTQENPRPMDGSHPSSFESLQSQQNYSNLDHYSFGAMGQVLTMMQGTGSF